MDTPQTKPPIVLDLGKIKKKDIKKLKDGEGRLVSKVSAAVAQAQLNLPAGKEVIPVVIVYRQKAKRAKRGVTMFGPF
jgi:hypothetical protein